MINIIKIIYHKNKNSDRKYIVSYKLTYQILVFSCIKQKNIIRSPFDKRLKIT